MRSNNELPLVSVLICNYNYGKFIGDAIDSVLAQTYRHIEIVVVDDGSSDDSRDVIQSYGERVVPVFKENGGQASAFNQGFPATTGGIVCLLDADDYFLPEKVQKVVQAFEANGEIGWCFDRLQQFEHATRELTKHDDTVTSGLWDVRRATIAGHPPFVPTATSGMAFRREVLARILPMPEMIRLTSGAGHDNYMKMGALALTTGWFFSDRLTMQRVHGANGFTRRPDEARKMGDVMLLATGISLYRSFPCLRSFGRSMIWRGLGKLRASGQLDSRSRGLADDFMKECGPVTRLRILAGAHFWNLRESGRRLLMRIASRQPAASGTQ